jgi:hypothetical protein
MTIVEAKERIYDEILDYIERRNAGEGVGSIRRMLLLYPDGSLYIHAGDGRLQPENYIAALDVPRVDSGEFHYKLDGGIQTDADGMAEYAKALAAEVADSDIEAWLAAVAEYEAA